MCNSGSCLRGSAQHWSTVKSSRLFVPCTQPYVITQTAKVEPGSFSRVCMLVGLRFVSRYLRHNVVKKSVNNVLILLESAQHFVFCIYLSTSLVRSTKLKDMLSITRLYNFKLNHPKFKCYSIIKKHLISYLREGEEDQLLYYLLNTF